jgi:hypothetical protein
MLRQNLSRQYYALDRIRTDLTTQSRRIGAKFQRKIQDSNAKSSRDGFSTVNASRGANRRMGP